MTEFWSQLQTAMNDLFVDTFQHTRTVLVHFLPRLLLAGLTLGVGWLGALLLRKLVVKLARALGLDVLSEKLGLHRLLSARGLAVPLSRVLGWFVYWTILLTAISLAFEQLGLLAAQSIIADALHWLPRLIAAIALLALGVFVSEPIGLFVERLARLAGLPLQWLAGRLVRLGIIALAILNALEYLHLASPTVLTLAAAALGGLVLLAFGVLAVFGRDFVSAVLAQRFLHSELAVGEVIETAIAHGEVIAIGRTTTRIREGDRDVLVPNHQLTRVVIRKPARDVLPTPSPSAAPLA